jgi:hypothetical protein
MSELNPGHHRIGQLVEAMEDCSKLTIGHCLER